MCTTAVIQSPFKFIRGCKKELVNKKENALNIILRAAKEYEKNLNGNNLLFLISDRHKNITYFEAEFNSGNFMHLTGTRLTEEYTKTLKYNKHEKNTEISFANVYYEKCINRRMSVDDFEFSEDGTTPLKLEVLPILMKANLSANIFGDFSSQTFKLYTEKVAGNIRGCIGFIKDKNNKNVPNTVLKTDIRDCIVENNRILATYRKKKEEKQYNEIIYVAKNLDLNNVKFPEEIGYLKNLK